MVVFYFHPISKIFYATHRCRLLYVKKSCTTAEKYKTHWSTFLSPLWLELLRKKFSVWGIGYLLRYCKKAFQMWPDNSYPFILYWITRVATACHFVGKQPLTRVVFILKSSANEYFHLTRTRKKKHWHFHLYIII